MTQTELEGLFEKNAPTEAATSDQGVTNKVSVTLKRNTARDDIAIYHIGIVSGLTVDHPNFVDIDYHIKRLFEYIRGVK